MIIDVHAHALREEFLQQLTRQPDFGLATKPDGKGGYYIKRGKEEWRSLDPFLHNLPARLESLKRRGVTRQLVAPPPGFISWPGGVANVELCRELNRQAAALVKEGEGLIEGMAVLPLAEPTRAVEELDRVMGEYGFRSAIISASAGGRPLDAEEFEPLLSRLEERRILLFMHPTSGQPIDRFGIYGVQVLVGWPFETALSITRMIFEGTLERHPGLRLVLAHGGGNLVFLRGRLDSAYYATGWEADPYYRRNISISPGDFFKRLFFDTCVLSPESLEFVLQIVGPDRVLFGSDYPFDIGDPEGKAAMPAIRHQSQDTQEKILYKNAEAILADVQAP